MHVTGSDSSIDGVSFHVFLFICKTVYNLFYFDFIKSKVAHPYKINIKNSHLAEVNDWLDRFISSLMTKPTVRVRTTNKYFLFCMFLHLFVSINIYK